MSAFNSHRSSNRLPLAFIGRPSAGEKTLGETIAAVLASLQELPSKNDALAASGVVERCEDESHIYLEGDLQEDHDAVALDLTIHEGRFYIRLAK
jgi:hypothetical protein